MTPHATPSLNTTTTHAHTPMPATLECCMYFFFLFFMSGGDTLCHPLPQHNTTHARTRICTLAALKCGMSFFFLCLMVTPAPPPPSTQHNACTPTPMPTALKCGMSVFFSCFSCLTVGDTPCHPLPQHNDNACMHTHACPHPRLPPSNAVCIFFLIFHVWQ